jgi:hypothetical protein
MAHAWQARSSPRATPLREGGSTGL